MVARLVLAVAAGSVLIAGTAEARMSDVQVRQQMIRESLASYPGNGPRRPFLWQ